MTTDRPLLAIDDDDLRIPLTPATVIIRTAARSLDIDPLLLADAILDPSITHLDNLHAETLQMLRDIALYDIENSSQVDDIREALHRPDFDA